MKELQELCGYLNFLGKAIFSGRSFTRRMYAKYSHCVNTNKGKSLGKFQHKVFALKPHHHIQLDGEFKVDCRVWLQFLQGRVTDIVNRPMIDILGPSLTSVDVGFYSDASGKIGYGCILQDRWCRGDWDPNFIKNEEPSIEYLELFALTAGIFTWAHLLKNKRIMLHCDNMAVVNMINNMTSSCKNCMILIRLLVLNNLRFNRRTTAVYILTKNNDLSDALSRGQMLRYRRLAPQMEEFPWEIHADLWPMNKVWMSNKQAIH